MVRVGLWYDFRNPEQWRRPLTDVYAETFEQIRWTEQLGFDDVWTTEHHFVADDYSPSLLPICAAIAAQTERLGIGTSVLLLPLHDPVGIAEDVATVDVISGGRMNLGVGLGYRLAEFKGLGIPTGARGQRMDEALQVIRGAWGSGPLQFTGRWFQYEGMNVTPKPVQSPLPLWVAGLSAKAVARAARLGDGFLAGAGPDLTALFATERKAAGLGPGLVATSLPFHAITDDLDAGWAQIGPHLLYQRRVYAEWLAEAGQPIWEVPDDVNAMRAAEPDLVVTPQRAREILEATLRERTGLTHLYWNPLLPGMRPSAAAETIARFAADLLPLVHA